MTNEIPDDGKPRLHAWTTKAHDRFQLISDTPVTRTEAIRLLRHSPPRELNGATTVQLADYENDGAPARLIGPTRVQHSLTEMVKSMMGFTINVPMGGTK